MYVIILVVLLYVVKIGRLILNPNSKNKTEDRNENCLKRSTKVVQKSEIRIKFPLKFEIRALNS